DREKQAIAGAELSAFQVLRDLRVWNLGLVFGSGLIGLYGLILWLPQIIKEMGNLSDIQVGFLSTISPALGIVFALFMSSRSDKKGDRKGHMAACYITAGVGLLAS